MKTVKRALIAATVLGMMAGTVFQANAASLTTVSAERAEQTARKTAITVNYADLNLGSSAGQKVLHSRIRRAAKIACGPSDSLRAGSRKLASRNKACYQASMSRALSEVNQSAIAAAN